MKPIVLAFLFVSSFLTANAQTFTEAVKFNDYIVEQQNLIGEKIMSFTGKFSEENMTTEAITPILEELLSTANNGVSAIKRVTPYEGGTELKQTAVELFQFYVTTIDRDYREMVSLVFGSNMDETAIARIQTILEKVTTDEAVYDGKFQAAQHAFADKYGFTLETNKLQEEIDKN